ncbi:type IV conjugative transfer system lipoprotein TraV [Pantoea cypripedii]|uniref:Type IV conjugative transfer system protein TraV n=1 Tax=Pantoea cypripedii TaxID=55209 RepID=A0A1X1EKX1_PANCY|nr:type IV conjugative transfer system lipoprotein TraV [Pantoea cypripedii]MBP2199064.1 conjugal transfer pilus assembly protein TraV [Pantoea cypripedii]ORM89472.1 type IV conjugative transfer system protein TraV [Pantoea cypripedii]
MKGRKSLINSAGHCGWIIFTDCTLTYTGRETDVRIPVLRKLFWAGLIALTLTGCAGMNSEFEFSKPAKDSGVWMAEADEMSAGTASGLQLDDYRLIDTGSILLAPQTVPKDAETRQAISKGPAGDKSGGYCSAPHCFPEPSAAFRRPDSVARIWIAPYVSPGNNVHMGEVIYTVANPADWHGILM